MSDSATNRTFYYWLDPIRAIAALLVLLVHVRSVMFETYGNLEPSSQNIFTIIFFTLCSLGAFSVCIFYILSGFLVGGKTIEKSKKDKISAKRFFLDRLFRIGVPLTGALVLICIVNLSLGIGVEWGQLFGQYLGLQGVLTLDYGGVFWTLPYEIWFYAILLAFILILNKNKHILIGVSILAMSFMVFCNLRSQFLYILVCGMVCYLIKDYKFNKLTRRCLWLLVFIAFGFYLVVQTHYISLKLGLLNYSDKLLVPSQMILLALITLLLSQYVTTIPTSKSGVFVNRVGKKLAIFSYSLFLTHYQILKIWKAYVSPMDSLNLKTMAYFIGVCIVCIIVAYLFYLIFEKNTRRIQTFVENILKI